MHWDPFLHAWVVTRYTDVVRVLHYFSADRTPTPEGVEVDLFPFRGSRHPANYLAAWKEVRRRVRAGRYDLVHAQFGQSGLTALPKRVPLGVTFRGDDLEGIIGENGRYTPAGWLLRFISRTVARRADAAIVVSEHMKRYLPRSVTAHGATAALPRKLPSSRLPSRVRMDSGWNCTPYTGNSRWQSAMISPSSLSAVISRQPGNEVRFTTSE